MSGLTGTRRDGWVVAAAVPALRREEADEDDQVQVDEEEEEDGRGDGRVDGGILGAGRLSTKLNEW